VDSTRKARGDVVAKRPAPGKCVHCLKELVERNWDHVFPVSWYPNASARDLYKWQIPSCELCNSELGEIESGFLGRVALCLDPESPASRSIVERALRATKPEMARNDRDRRARASRRKRILDDILQGAEIPDHGVYPGLGEKWGRPTAEQVAITVPVEYFRRLTDKIVRGIFYIQDQIFIEPPYEIEFFALAAAGAEPMCEALDRFGTIFAREPGIVVHRAVAPEDGISSLFEIEFWGQFKMYASVTREGADLCVSNWMEGATP
jgi:hypothetical protein